MSPRNEIIYTDSPEFVEIEAKWNSITKHILYQGNPTDEEFKDNNYKISKIPENQATYLLSVIDDLPRLKFKREDCHLDFVGTNLGDKETKALSDNFPFHNLQEQQLKLITEICEEIDPVIKACIGCNYRILNMRGFGVNPNTQTIGPNRSHVDARFPRDTYKVILYLTPAGGKYGHTNIKVANRKPASVIGPPGTFLFFNPVQNSHNGICPTCERRKEIIEITLVPWRETIIKPIFGGTNSRHPIE